MPPASEVQHDFGRRLREVRKQRGITQEALAAAAGLDRSYVGCVERGERNVTLVNIHRLAAACGVEPARLLDPPGQEVT